MIDIKTIKDNLCNELDNSFEKVLKVQRDITLSEHRLITLNITIDNKEKLIKQLDKIETQLNDLENYRGILNKEIHNLQNDYNQRIKDIDTKLDTKLKQSAQLDKDYSFLKNKHDKELEKIIPKIEDLVKREEIVQRKEQDLSVIERRYRKLLKIYGANFKV